MDLYRLNDRNYTFTALATSVVSSDALTSQCYAIIINASEPVFIKITHMGRMQHLDQVDTSLKTGRIIFA